MASDLFISDKYLQIEQRSKAFLNQQTNILSKNTLNSPRAVGDALQEIVAINFQEIAGTEICPSYSGDFARRSMADFAFEDADGFYYVVDVKTHRLSTKFNMPNLTSVERLSRFYETDKNYFVLLLIAYEINDAQVDVSQVRFVPIEFLGWDCLTIGALGWGQIQIANSNRITVNSGYPRKKWMLELFDGLLELYPHEIEKITVRIEHFVRLKKQWEQRPD